MLLQQATAPQRKGCATTTTKSTSSNGNSISTRNVNDKQVSDAKKIGFKRQNSEFLNNLNKKQESYSRLNVPVVLAITVRKKNQGTGLLQYQLQKEYWKFKVIS